MNKFGLFISIAMGFCLGLAQAEVEYIEPSGCPGQMSGHHLSSLLEFMMARRSPQERADLIEQIRRVVEGSQPGVETPMFLSDAASEYRMENLFPHIISRGGSIRSIDLSLQGTYKGDERADFLRQRYSRNVPFPGFRLVGTVTRE